VNQAAATAASVRSAQANVERLRELQSLKKIYAPFDGVVTARTIDTGQLIDTGAGKELFHLQAIQTLRVYTNLPQTYSQNVKRGTIIDLSFAEHPARFTEGHWCAPPTPSIRQPHPAGGDRCRQPCRRVAARLDGRGPLQDASHRAYLHRARRALIFRKEGLRVGVRSQRQRRTSGSGSHR